MIITSPGLSQQNRNRNKGREQQTQRLFKNRTLTEIDSIVWGMEDYFNKKKQEDRLKELQEMAGAFGDQKKVELLDLNKKNNPVYVEAWLKIKLLPKEIIFDSAFSLIKKERIPEPKSELINLCGLMKPKYPFFFNIE